MRTFDEIYSIAVDRKGGVEALESEMQKPIDAAKVAAIPEDRWLAQFTRSVFQAGFSWKVIEAKWEGFEEAFHGFDVDRNAMMSDEDLDAYLRDTRIVRNGQKIVTVRDNAIFIRDLRNEGGIGKVIGEWPGEDYIGLLDMLKKRASRMGGTSGQYVLRMMGKDSFILSRDVVARLIAEAVIDKPPTSKGAMRAVQSAFNEWKSQSGRSLTEISRVLAMSI